MSRDYRFKQVVDTANRIVLGDKSGTIVFLVSIVFFALTWRIGPFINDNYTIANALVAVSKGNLHIEQAVYGTPRGPISNVPETPGTHLVDGQVYGRNYGHVFLALPFLWGLELLSATAGVATGLSVLWSGAVFAVVVRLATRLNRRRVGLFGGGAFATVLLVANLAVADPIPPRLHALMALQLTTMLAAALVAVFVYRTVTLAQDRRTGLGAGAAVALATPVGFWATIPKRHSLTALLVVATLYCFYRSRSAPTLRGATRYRALAYVPVALTAWVHAPEAFVLMLALGTVDFLTARSNGPRQLAVVAIVFAVALLPFFVTNTLVVGNPIEPARTWPAYDVDLGSNGTGDTGRLGGAVGLVGTVLAVVELFLGHMARAVGMLIEPGRLFDTFVRSGNELGLGQAIIGGPSLNISVLESTPLAAALLVAPILGVRRLGKGRPLERLSAVRTDPNRATDLLVFVYLLLLVVMYLPRLPIQVSFTVRYLHPLYPLAVYGLARLAVLRRVVDTESRLLAKSYTALLIFGGPLLVVALAALAGELEVAVQLHARLALATAAVLVYWAVVSTTLDERHDRGGAVALALAAAVASLYTLLSAWVYFPYADRYAVPLARVVADLLVLW